MTGKHTAERLMQVVRVLEELPKEKKFDMSEWGHCGTVACAVGWAGQDQWFTRRGLYSHKDSSGSCDIFLRGADQNWDAVETFFKITDEAAWHLFAASSYKRASKYDVIRRIRKFVREECG